MTPPRRQLGLGVTIAIVIANMIGTGIFTTTGFQANALHDPLTILLVWVVGGVIALCGAVTYAELGSMMPRAGGEYVYLREAFHPAVGFMSGWVSLTAGFSAPIAVSALAFSKYLATMVPAMTMHTVVPYLDGTHKVFSEIVTYQVLGLDLGVNQIVAILLILAIAALHSFDTKVGGWVQAGFTAAKVLLIVLFILGGLLLGTGDWSNLGSQSGGLSNIWSGAFPIELMFISFAYSGWNAAAYIASDVRNPSKTLPRALIVGTGIVMVLYILINIVFFYAVPSSVLAGPTDSFNPVIEVGDTAARSLFGNRVGELVSAVIALALVSAVSAMIMAGPRVYAAMAADRALPRLMAKHNKRGVPIVAVAAQGLLGVLFVLVNDLGQLIRFVVFSLNIFAALAVIAVFVLRTKGYRGTYRTLGYPVTPAVFILGAAWTTYRQAVGNPLESVIVIAVLAVGAAVYFLAVSGKPPLATENDPEDTPPAPSGRMPVARVVSDK